MLKTPKVFIISHLLVTSCLYGSLENRYVCVFCSEETLFSVQCVLMVYNDSSKQWISCGNHTFSHIYILHNVVNDTYRFVGLSEQDKEACIFHILVYWYI